MNCGSCVADNMTEFNGFDGANEPTTPTFVNYVAGISCGIPIDYEAAAQEGLIRYDEHVVCPVEDMVFSYTALEQEMGPIRRGCRQDFI